MKNADIIANDSGQGRWIEKWRSPTTGAWVHNYSMHQIARAKGRKFADNIRFGARLPLIRARYRADLRGRGKSRTIALIVALIDQCCFRVGNEASAARGIHGVTTLRKKHVCIRGSRAEFDYVAKQKKVQHKVVMDPRIARLIAAVRTAAKGPEARLFQHQGRPITADDINAYLAPYDVTAKMFRTFHATRVAMENLARAPAGTKAEREASIKAMLRHVSAAILGNTPAVCAESYVDPAVIRAFRAGRLRRKNR